MNRFFGLVCVALLAAVAPAMASWDGVTSVTRTSMAPASCGEMGCMSSCSESYTVAIIGTTMTLAPGDVAGCTCYQGTLTIDGSTASGQFADGTDASAEIRGETVTVVAGGQCTGTYSTASAKASGAAAATAGITLLTAVVAGLWS